MDINEYFSFIPLLLYGVALADLFSQWRRFFEKEYVYLPYVLSTVVFTESAIWNIYLFIIDLQGTKFTNYYHYWSFLIQPILFVLIIHAFTPETKNKDTEAYFKNRMRVVFVLFAIYIALHLLPGGTSNQEMLWPRVIGIVFCLVIAFSRYVPLVYAFAIVWFISLFFR